MSTPSDAHRGADIALDLTSQLTRLLDELKSTPRNTAAIRSWLQVHVYDLKSIVAAERSSYDLLRRAAHAGHPDIVLALFEAGLRPDEHLDVYGMLLRNFYIFDLNGDELDDAGIAARLRCMRDVHGLRDPPSQNLSLATEECVANNRLDCLRFMIDVDPHSRGHSIFGHDSLLHLAAWCCKPRIAEYLMQSGWSLTSHDLNEDGLSPLGACVFAARRVNAEAVCATLSQLLRNIEDAASVVRASGLCDVTPAAPNGYEMPSRQSVRMHIYVCAAANAVSSLPLRVMISSEPGRLESSPSIFHSLPLDEHVITATGVVYLRDPLRLGGITTLPLAAVEHGHTAHVTEAVPVHALRFAVTVDALCAKEEVVCAYEDSTQWEGERYTDVLDERRAPSVTCISPTLRHWAWMRRLHAVHARRQALLVILATQAGVHVKCSNGMTV